MVVCSYEGTAWFAAKRLSEMQGHSRVQHITVFWVAPLAGALGAGLLWNAAMAPAKAKKRKAPAKAPAKAAPKEKETKKAQ